MQKRTGGFTTKTHVETTAEAHAADETRGGHLRGGHLRGRTARASEWEEVLTAWGPVRSSVKTVSHLFDKRKSCRSCYLPEPRGPAD